MNTVMFLFGVGGVKCGNDRRSSSKRRKLNSTDCMVSDEPSVSQIDALVAEDSGISERNCEFSLYFCTNYKQCETSSL